MRQVDPIERDIEVALKPRAFIRDGECFSFVNGLDEVDPKGWTKFGRLLDGAAG